MIANDHGTLDDDAWKYTHNTEAGTVLEAVAWVLSGWSVHHPSTDKMLFASAQDFMVRLRKSQLLTIDKP